MKAIKRFFDFLYLLLSDYDGMCNHCKIYTCASHPSNNKQQNDPSNCIYFNECQRQNQCCNAKIESSKCIGIECGEFKIMIN